MAPEDVRGTPQSTMRVVTRSECGPRFRPIVLDLLRSYLEALVPVSSFPRGLNLTGEGSVRLSASLETDKGLEGFS